MRQCRKCNGKYSEGFFIGHSNMQRAGASYKDKVCIGCQQSTRDNAKRENIARDYNQAYEIAVQMLEYACKGGEILAESPKYNGARPSDTGSQPATPSLSDIGMTKSQSSRWQKMASVDEEIREQYYDKMLDKEELPTNAGLLKIAKRKQKH